MATGIATQVRTLTEVVEMVEAHKDRPWAA